MRLFTLALVMMLSFAQGAFAGESNGVNGESKSTASFDQKEVMAKAEGFFGDVSEGLAKAISKVFEDQGEPNAIITGEEISGAIGIGVRYGQGEIQLPNGSARDIFWQGPSVGFDAGGNASKTFTLVYNLKNPEQIFQRFPGVEGSFYFVAGVGVNYLQSGNVIIAPIRTGVGMRTGANIGYLHFTKKKSWIPF
nr:DUF1134 domain-containing protein [Spongiibacter pelagi]